MRHPEMLAMSDDEVRQLVTDELHLMLKVPAQVAPDLIHISRHEKAIPQYEASTGDRLVAVEKLQRQFPGLTIGGNLRDGIGMAHRITQATNIANSIFEKYFAK
jgi:oxygen-dependent protoporphyrinogen oxidase